MEIMGAVSGQLTAKQEAALARGREALARMQGRSTNGRYRKKCRRGNCSSRRSGLYYGQRMR